ncbi:MAG TPA: Gfo/Idh/MocA family oxidoreductase, partial [Acidimicrobiales bacterium]|nr:Gfo/Idh/MocA family oxidoreductase [Acidimicrobiales bacterium]
MATVVGFLGTGFIARFHAAMLEGSGEAFVAGPVHDTDAGRAAAFAADHGYTVAGSEEAVLDAVDAVYVTTWTSEHLRLVQAAAERGVHVFCEKPLAVSADDARAIAEIAEGAGIVNQSGLVLRRSPAFGMVQGLLADPAAGRPMAVVFRDDQFLPVRGMYGSDWRADPTRAGAGTLLEHSIHDLDLLGWLLGPVANVSCRTASFHGLDGIEDVAVATLSFASGATASLTSIWHDVDERPSLRNVEVFCERAYVAVEGDWSGPVRHRFAGDAEETVLEGEPLAAEARRRGARLGNPDGSFLRA